VVVLHAGRIVEEGPTEKLFSTPAHPLTRELLAAAGRWDRSPEADRGDG
jgi:peptide/nickel transport system ATP-binding protein